MPPPARLYVNTAELDAARAIVRMTIRLQRHPTPAEAWPILKEAAPHSRLLKILRNKERVAEVGEKGLDWSRIASRKLVQKRLRQLLAQSADLLRAKDDIEQMRQEISRASFQALLDALERDGPYDHTAKLVDAKMRGALAAIRLGGHSLEESQPQVQVNVSATPSEDSLRLIREERMRLRDEQMASRRGLVLEVEDAEVVDA